MRWKEIQVPRSTSALWNSPYLNFSEDTQLLLLGSKEFISRSLANHASQALKSNFYPQFIPKFTPRHTLYDFLLSPAMFGPSYHADPYVTLYDVELAVEWELDNWVARVTSVEEACSRLVTLMNNYLSHARDTYKHNPEHVSIMLLTGVELWIALDKLVVQRLPMMALSRYCPVVLEELLHMPLFCETVKLHRFYRTYEYLSTRHTCFRPDNRALSLEWTGTLFTTVYDSSSSSSYAGSENFLRYMGLEGDATPQEIAMTMHQRRIIAAFELECPQFLRMWAHGTSHLLNIAPPSLDPVHTILLAELTHLKSCLVKKHTAWHGHVYFVCHAEDPPPPQDETSRHVTGYHRFLHYRCPQSKSLAVYINGTSHTPNDVLAAQSECPGDLSPQEFIAFGHLRSGGSLQWINILQGLRTRSLNFRRHDVYFLISKAALQVGPFSPNTSEWSWHNDLQNPSFCYVFLEELENLIVEVAVHSQEAVMMSTISLLLTRLLASSPCEDVSEQAIGLLQRVRRRTLHWAEELSYDLMTAPMNTERKNILRDMAATCRSTFDVGPVAAPKLVQSAEDVGALLFCAILIRANYPLGFKDISEYSRLLLERDHRHSLFLEGILRKVLQGDMSHRGIDLAVQSVWPGYRPYPQAWQSLPHPYSHWLTSKTSATQTRRSQIIHLNLLDGTLLIDGTPIDGLPDKVMSQPTYRLIFGDQRFLVVSSDLPGMDFSTLAEICEHRVHFALQDDDIVIQAQHKDAGDVLQVIPQDKLKGDLPTNFISNYIHWLNLSTSIVEVRPLEKLWESSSENWRIDCRSEPYRMYKGSQWLVDPRSSTHEMVSSRLERLDVSDNLIITTFPVDGPQSRLSLSVDLARYGLSFFVNGNEELESRDFRNMVYDENQCIGTFFGLEHKLVLRPSVQIGQFVHRRVITPDGRVSREQRGQHVRITVDAITATLASKTITYHTYRVDTELQCLAGNESWRSKLYLAYLHAQTSIDWMPDPLTCRTGVQEALRVLQSADCRSIMKLDSTEEVQFPLSSDYGMYPQLKFAMEEIEYCIHREGFLRGLLPYPPDRPKLDIPNALQTAYLFSPEFMGRAKKPVEGDHTPKLSETEDLVRFVSLAVFHWLVRKDPKSRDDIEVPDDSWPDPDHLPSPITQLDTYLKACSTDFPRNNLKIPPPSITEVEALLQEATKTHQQFRLLFLLSATVYCVEQYEPAFLSIIVALAKRFPLENPPRYDQCQPLDGYCPSRSALRDCCNNARFPAPGLQPDHDTRPDVELLIAAWPFRDVPAAILPSAHLYNRKKLKANLGPLISECYSNNMLKEDLTGRLTELHIPPSTLQLPPLTSDPPPRAHHWPVTLDQLFDECIPPELPSPSQLEPQWSGTARISTTLSSHSEGTHRLNELFASLRMNEADPTFQKQYITHLHASARYARELPRALHRGAGRPSVAELRKHYAECKDRYSASLSKLKDELCPSDNPLAQALRRSAQWPDITPGALFQCLASTATVRISCDWKKCLVSLALLLVELQRSRRLLQFALENLEEELSRDLENMGCEGWNAEEYPDWLLIQVQGNFLIRSSQADAAMNMIYPSRKQNITVQVNMGEGKSSVILPISAATLADGNQLLRVIVPKALTVQMFQLLTCRLGGLVNRPIYHLPFSRGSITDECRERKIQMICELLSECVCKRGVLVVQPEHVLSLRLISMERRPSHGTRHLHEGSSDALLLLELQRWIHSHARDILDESDDILHPRFQLMYTIGAHQAVEGSPDRWVIIQQVLRLLRKHALSLSQDLPHAVEYERNTSGSFPRIRILSASDASRRLISLIVEDVMAGHLTSFSLRNIRHDRRLQAAIRDFISFKDVPLQKAKFVEEHARNGSIWDGLLLVRGLLACNVLLFALAQRRWRVDYGLSPARTKLAVPYRAKDVPAPRAEFGHPDLAIILTCLSYYYGGLTEEQLRVSFGILHEQDDPSTEYASWLQDYESGEVPEAIRDLSDLKINSSVEWDKYIYPLFSRNQGAVDFYLSRVVFPEEAVEFPQKLVGTSWDLVEARERPITGLSGTNDGQYLLPTSITQQNLEHQQGSNARVLSSLLQPENDFYMLISHPNGERQTIPGLLRIVVEQQPRIRVLLDVGAQIIGLSNYLLAKAWLAVSLDSDGAVYFNEGDEPMVLTKDGASRPLLSSPFAQKLERCVVYLDEAHTRGTDLALPHGCRAAVTLGPQVTKDRLIQGCMRMRKLGQGHSIMFLAPLEVDRKIRTVAAKEDPNSPVIITDILHWSINETWADIQYRAPYWAQQGINHDHRYSAWTRFCADELGPEELVDTWLQPELKSLTNLYAPFQPKSAQNCPSVMYAHPEILQHCMDLGVLQISDTEMEEEQEREVSREIEREREVRKLPQDVTPVEHMLHPDVTAFVQTGVIPSIYKGTAFHPLSAALVGSSAATSELHGWTSFILATSDFCKTVRVHPSLCQGKTMDPYLRSVQWVLSGKWDCNQILVLLSPYEVDRLLPDIRVSNRVHLHVYTPRISERMRPDNLMFYSIPSTPHNWNPPLHLMDQLNIFAGELYLSDYDSYLRLCSFLRIRSQDLPKNVGTAVRRNQITAGVLQELDSALVDSPLPSVLRLLLIRRRGLSFSETHMGRIFQGQILTETDFKLMEQAKLGSGGPTRPRPAIDIPISMSVAPQGDASVVSASFSWTLKREREESESVENSGPPCRRLRPDSH